MTPEAIKPQDFNDLTILLDKIRAYLMLIAIGS
jgi:hypothetical protein